MKTCEDRKSTFSTTKKLSLRRVMMLWKMFCLGKSHSCMFIKKIYVQIWKNHISVFTYSLVTVRLKMYYQKKFKQWCYMVHLCIKNKINMWALFWLDQNYRFFIAKLTVFWSHFSLPKMINFAIEKSVILIKSKKGSDIDFVFDA